MYIYVYIHIYTYLSTYIHTRLYIYTYLSISMYTYLYIPIYIHTNVQIRIYRSISNYIDLRNACRSNVVVVTTVEGRKEGNGDSITMLYISLHTPIDTYIYTSIHTFLQLCMYTYIYPSLSVHTHLHISIDLPQSLTMSCRLNVVVVTVLERQEWGPEGKGPCRGPLQSSSSPLYQYLVQTMSDLKDLRLRLHLKPHVFYK